MPDEALLERQDFVTCAIGELLAAALEIQIPMSPERIPNIFMAYLENLAGGNETYLAKLLNVSRGSVHGWIFDNQTPKLSTLIDVSDRLGKSPLEFLTQENAIVDQTVLRKLTAGVSDSRDPAWRKSICKQSLPRKLSAIVAADETPLPSMRQVSKRLSHDHSHLIKLFPEQTKIISQRYREYQSRMCQERIEKTQQQVSEATIEVVKQGEYPSLHRAQAFLEKPCHIWEAIEIWRKTKQQMGYWD